MSGEPPDRNTLARQVADLTDDLASLRAEFASSQQSFIVEMSRMECQAGMSVEAACDKAREDGYEVGQILLDKVWHEGYMDGISAAEKSVSEKRKQARDQGWRP